MYSAIAANKRRTIYLMFFFIVLIGAMGWAAAQYFGNSSITIYVLVGAGLYALVQYFLASKLALAMNGAHEIAKKDHPELYRLVENLAIADGLPTPKIYIMEDAALNAFATGRDPQHAVVAVTAGLLEAMEKTELEGVLAHEMSHIKNYDIRVMMIVVGLVGAIGFLADMIMHMMWFGGGDNEERPSSPIFLVAAVLAAVLAPLAAMLIQLAISRRREYLADSSGALLTRYPEGLASALEKIQHHGSTMRRQNTATAHLFLANPLKGGSFAKLFSTHPPVKDRIAKLRAMSDKL